jgi:hypothetical protein
MPPRPSRAEWMKSAETLVHALRWYGQHSSECIGWTGGGVADYCDCGLNYVWSHIASSLSTIDVDFNRPPYNGTRD